MLKKKVFFNPQKHLNKKFFFIGGFVILLVLFFSYFLKPIYFDYNTNKEIIEEKINNTFKLQTKIEGNISYSAFPRPVIVVENIKLNFGKNKPNQLKIKKTFIKIASNKISNINQLEFKKLTLVNQEIKVNTSNLKQIFIFLTLHKKGQVELKNSKVIFEDNQKNKINFDNVNLNDKFKNNKHKINAKLNFSNNQIKISFKNLLDSAKILKISIPSLKQNLEINFEKESTLKNLSGDLKLNIFNSILLLNFKGKDNFEISKSYLRNKYLNSKINGKISFKNPFNFNINLDVNQINFRKLFKYYENFQNKKISKKINGLLNIKIKNTETAFGKLKDAKMQLNFQNGDLRVTNFIAELPHKSSLKSNFLLILNNNKPTLEYNVKFSSENADKFLRKFSIYDFEQKKANWSSEGIIDIKNKKIKILKIFKNQVRLKNKNQIKLMEEAFNKNIINEEITGLFDTFKFKKFLKEIY